MRTLPLRPRCLMLSSRLALVLAPLLGALATLAFAPLQYSPLLPLALAGLWTLVLAASPKRGFLLGWLFGLAHFGSGIYWVYISTHIYGGAPAWLGALLGLVLFSYLALYPALVAAALAWLSARHRPAALWALPALYTLAELLRGHLFTGFAWLNSGDTLLDTPAQTLIPLLGVYGGSLLLAGLASAITALLALRRWQPLALASAALAGLCLLLPPASHWTQAQGAPISVAIIQGQGDIRMNQKWLPENRERLISRFRELSLAEQSSQWVIWPEGPLPATYAALAPYYFAELNSAYQHSGHTLFASALVETPATSNQPGGLLNSTVLLGQSQGRYDKRHLVPFGEFFPIPDWLRPVMDVLGTPYSDFTAGPAQQPLLKVQGTPVFANICFEDVFPNEFRQRALGAAVLINQTNDSWFGEGLAPWQHLNIARMRALENGRWFIRATNSGVSALIAPSGQVVAKTPALYQVAVLRGQIWAQTGLTPYARWGDAPVLWFCLFLASFGVGFAYRRGKH